MHRQLALVCGILVMIGGTWERAMGAEGASGDDRIFNLPYKVKDLDNGLRIIVVPTDYPDIVTIQIPVQTGSRNEVEAGKSGFAHFFEHMMFRGTDAFPPDKYGEILKNAGADQNAYTTDDYTNYHTTFTAADLETVVKIEADRFKNLKYSEDQFRTEALAVKGEYLKNYANPIQKLFERLRDLAYTKHTYKHTTMGFFRDIEDMPNQLAYSRTFFDRWYRPEYTTVILCGDVQPEQGFKLVEKYWGDWKRGSWKVDIPVEPTSTGSKYDHITWESPTQPWVLVAFHGPAFDGKDKSLPALDIAAQHYFGDTSELYQRLVIKDQLVDQLWTSFPQRKDPGLLVVAARTTSADAMTDVHQAILDTLARSRSEDIDAGKLREIKSRMKYAFASRMDNSETIGAILARFVHFRRDPEILNELYRTYDAITAEDVRKAADRYFTDNAMTTLTLSNEPEVPGWQTDASVDKRVSRPATASAAELDLVELRGNAPLIDVSLVFRAGAVDDPPGKKGLAALTAEMITEGGSQSMPIQEIQEALYPLAAGFGNQVDKEMIRLAGSVHRDNLWKWYGIVTDQLLEPGFRDEDLERLKKRRINAIRTNLVGNNDEELGKEILYESIYGADHAYGSLNLGHTSDIEGITMADVKGFYERYFTPENLTVGLAGGYDDTLVQRLRSDLARLPRGSREHKSLTTSPAINDHEAIIIQKETPGVAVSFGFPIDVHRGDPDWAALWLVRSWLGEHRSSNSHLFNRIREERGMNYGDYAYIEYFPGGMFGFHPSPNLGRRQQIFQVWIRPLRSNNDAHFATRTAVYEMNKLIRDGLDKEDFETTRNYLRKFVALLVKTQSRQLGYAIDSKYYGIAPFTDYVRAELEKLTLDDVNRVIRKYLQTDDMKFVFITRDAEDLKQRLVSNAESPITYNSPKPELAGEDAEIKQLRLNFGNDRVRIVDDGDVFK